MKIQMKWMERGRKACLHCDLFPSEWILNVLRATSSLLIENICKDTRTTTGDKCEHISVLHEVQVKVPTSMSHVNVNIWLPEEIFFFFQFALW